MPIKKDKRKKKITLLKQKQKQTQTVVINLADLVKRRPRAKPLVEPKAKKPSEMILTRIIREPTFTPPYQHHVTEPVKVTTAGLAQPKYIPKTYETYNPKVNEQFIEKFGQQSTPLRRDVIEIEPSIHPILPVESLQDEPENPLLDKRTYAKLYYEKNKEAIAKRAKERRRLKAEADEREKNWEEMTRRRERERELRKEGGYPTIDESD